MIDFHSHILPNIDDGSINLDMSIIMLQESIKEGLKHICATPHFIAGECEVEREAYNDKVEELRNIYADDITIVSGLEVYINPDLARLYKDKKIWCINDSRYMLIELPMREFPIYTEKVFYQLRLEGIIPILAHPERNLSIIKNVDLLVNLVEQGNLAQMNASSLTGMYGSEIKKAAEKLVSMNLIHVIGSDGHNSTTRPCKLLQGINRVNEINPQLYRWILENQGNILQGKEVDVLEVKLVKEKKHGLFSIFLKK